MSRLTVPHGLGQSLARWLASAGLLLLAGLLLALSGMQVRAQEPWQPHSYHQFGGPNNLPPAYVSFMQPAAEPGEIVSLYSGYSGQDIDFCWATGPCDLYMQ